ncbi:CAMK family protein kinase [Trichomonas vaginalis G3]|uniref:non-specific serine/threonine protein kinase n=1 Tax=Trichomonas vaginalis (strain ATCC PRA-98 / G3) TaxID=412133 RepID=A2EUJ6_TRIV3|nr:protein serine/threonine kinase protein [Trichomonas vaginalis G3]EAY03698.1 CAMK family protein kinase [Trichomonas vaginalis G3]KAI5532080.1 protein serine/threonine kinase protein [Trichomonas vaginalis G3]|eukprot:XP_001315921.1 CAMK family protein kinase [Trichomonas vaginalis G3]
MGEVENIQVPPTIGKYTIGEKIGSGAFSSVFKGTHMLTKIDVAIKVISKKSFTDQKFITRFMREVNLLKQMNHPMINELYDLYEDEKYHYLIMEYSPNGDLLSFINKNGKLIEPIARRYFTQLFSVLEYLHKERKVAHRDLKAENILLDRYFNLRIIDFGLSNCFTDENNVFETKCGSPAYIPPEMIIGYGYTPAADMWSTGVLLYAMSIGSLPFDDENVKKTLQLIVYANPTYPPSISPALADLLQKLLTKDPLLRITLDKIKEHPWFSKLEYDAIYAYQKKIQEVTCDPEIVSQMERYGLDTTNLRQNLFLGVYDETTAVYRMLRKMKVTFEMKTAMRARPSAANSTPQPNKMLSNISVEGVSQGRSIQIHRTQNNSPLMDHCVNVVAQQATFRPLAKPAVRVNVARCYSTKPQGIN